MGKTISSYRLALIAICAFTLFGSIASAQGKDIAPARHRGVVQDWTKHHVMYARYGSYKSILAAQRDPRAIDAWLLAILKEWNLGRLNRGHKSPRSTVQRDWSIPLGSGGVAPTMYPAKFGFDAGATPSCPFDFIVFPVNTAGTITQPNIVGFNNLYSGTTPGPTGACNRTPSGTDDGVSATTLWSYNIQGITGGGSVATSPTLSLDGAKVAFVETAPGKPAHFHVLAWKKNDGQDPTNLQNVLLPKTILSFTTAAPIAGSGTATDLAFGSTSDTLSSPFIDYTDDLAYVGNDAGILFRVKDVFCTADPACSGGTPPAPSIDSSWGTSGSVTVCSGSILTAPVLDSVTGNIFVGCSDGKLYGFTSTGAALANSPLVVGDGTATGGIVDPALIDAINGFVYVTSGSSAGGTAVIVQAKTNNLSSPRTAILGAAGVFNMHAPDFNDAYFNSVLPSSNWLLYDFGTNPTGGADATGTRNALYAVSFDSSHIMNTGIPLNVVYPTTPFEFSPVTEFLNGSDDQLFFSVLTNLGNDVLVYDDINSFATVAPTAAATEGTGTSGIVVDNASTTVNQASSIYFGTLGGVGAGNTAVKLTQSGLQ